MLLNDCSYQYTYTKWYMNRDYFVLYGYLEKVEFQGHYYVDGMYLTVRYVWLNTAFCINETNK